MARRNGGFVGQDGLDAPDPPTGVAGTAGGGSISIAFTAPSDAGTSAITGFVAQVSTDDTAYSAGSNTGTSSPIVVSSLTNGTAATAKVWAINAYGTSAPSAASASFTPALDRILHMGGRRFNVDYEGSTVNTIEFITPSTTGNPTDFGDLLAARYDARTGAAGSSTRTLYIGGGSSNVIQYINPASAGNATDFGDAQSSYGLNAGSTSNSTRAVFGEGTATLSYVTIASAGNASTFGALTEAAEIGAALASSTRGVFHIGRGENTSGGTILEYITIGSTGNSTDFGDPTQGRRSTATGGSGTRGILSGGDNGSGTKYNVIDYITIASTGNASDFGDLAAAINNHAGAGGTTRSVFFGGSIATSDPNNVNTIQYITTASTGNATDFGDVSTPSSVATAGSANHGGLQ